MRLKLTVRNIGGSRGLIIPAEPAKAEGISIGDVVEITIKKA